MQAFAHRSIATYHDVIDTSCRHTRQSLHPYAHNALASRLHAFMCTHCVATLTCMCMHTGPCTRCNKCRAELDSVVHKSRPNAPLGHSVCPRLANQFTPTGTKHPHTASSSTSSSYTPTGAQTIHVLDVLVLVTGTTPIRSSQSGTIHARSVSGYGPHTPARFSHERTPLGGLTVTVNRNHY